METVMQNHISDMKQIQEMVKSKNVDRELEETILVSIDGCIENAQSFLEAEKEQIMEAFHKGQVAVFEIIKSKFPQHKFEATQHEVDLVESGKEINEDAEDYYQQTYKSEQ